MWSIFLHTIAPFLMAVTFIAISIWMFKYKFENKSDRIISIIFFILGCFTVFIGSFNLNEAKKAIKDYNILLNKDKVSNISSIVIKPHSAEPWSKTIKEQIVIKNKSDIAELFKELNKIKSTNPNVSLEKTVELNIYLNNNDLIVLSISKTKKISDVDGCLIKMIVNGEVYGKYKSKDIWDIFYIITGNDYFK